MMLVIGLVIGCWLAWHWVSKEDRKIREDKGDKEIQEDKEDKNE
jgi:ATP synthase protein I